MSIEADASGDYVRRSTDLPTPGDWTTTFWFKLLAVPASAGSGFTASNATSGNIFFILSATTPSLFRLSTPTGGTTTIATVTTGDWQFVALRQSGGSTVKGFHWTLGGTLSTQEHSHTASGAITLMAWGSGTGASNWLNSRIAALKLWDASLSDAEIASEMLTILPKRLDGLNEFCPCFPGTTERLAGYSKARNLTAFGTLSDGDPPPVGWGASPIIIGPAAAAAASYELTDYGFFLPDGVGV